MTVRVEPGLPTFEINRVASEVNASMIVIGCRKVSAAREVLLGTLTTEVLSHSRHPVLVLRLPAEEPDEQMHSELLCSDFRRHVLFATDFSDPAESAFAYVEKLVATVAGRVTLLHVQDCSQIGPDQAGRLEELNRIDERRLVRMATRLRELGAGELYIRVEYGHPVEEILKSADRKGVTLVVMGCRGRRAIASVLLGSVSHQVTHRSSVPVLLVPPIG